MDCKNEAVEGGDEGEGRARRTVRTKRQLEGGDEGEGRA